MGRRPASENIDREKTVAEALALLDDVGVEGVTMRQLAQRMGVKPPSLYWHFSSKQELLEELANALVVEVAPIDGDHNDLEGLAHQLRAALLAHRDGGRVFAGTFAPRPHVLRIADTALQDLLARGVSEERAIDTIFNVIYYVLGFVIEEQSFQRQWEGAAPSQVRAAFTEVASSDLYPSLNRSLEALYTPNLDRRFDSGVRLLLAEVSAAGGSGARHVGG